MTILCSLRLTTMAVATWVTLASPAAAAAAEPPACDSGALQANMRLAYMAWLPGTPKVRVRLEDVHETGYGAAGSGGNPYVPTATARGRSRYCEARVVLSNGQKDVGYFRVDTRDDAPDRGFILAPCFWNHSGGDGCAGERPPH
ncbi:MAG: hypothetical protein ABI624_01390 [Casimicrobiaceae bacterium]